MATHLTEEEQLEALKRWWSENWVTIVLPIIVGVLLYVGWFWWQDHKTAQAELASDKFEALSTLLDSAQETADLTDEQKKEVVSKAEGIVSEHSKTLYADLANLILAGLYVDDKELDKAANTINRVVQNGANDGIKLLARARLAKVYLAQGRADEALMLVAQTDDPAYASIYSETRGDILLSQGNVAAANTAYKNALDKLDPQAFSRSGLLQAKISASSVAEADSAPALPVPAPITTEEAAESSSSESTEPAATASGDAE